MGEYTEELRQICIALHNIDKSLQEIQYKLENKNVIVEDGD